MTDEQLDKISVMYLEENFHHLKLAVHTVSSRWGITTQEGYRQIAKELKKEINSFSSAERLSKYLVRKVYNNTKDTYVKEVMYWFVVNNYYVDMTTTKENLRDTIKNKVIKYY